MGCPIRISTDQSLFAAPHGFSQRTTSFIACACQGIHQMPLRHLIVLIAHDHQVDPKGANRERRSRALHSREPCKSRQRVQRHPRSCSMAPASTPSLGRTAAGKKTSFQRRTPRAAVRHTHPCKGAVRSSRAMNPPGGDPRTEPRSASRLRTILQDPSSLHLFKNRQTSGPMTRAATSLLSSWIHPRNTQPTQPHKTGVVELVGIEPTTPCLQSRCSPS